MEKIFIIFSFLLFTSVFAQNDTLTNKPVSLLKIPYTHFDYNDIEASFSDSIHSAIKPLHYFEINPNILRKKYADLMLPKKTWLGRKLFNENMFNIAGKDYWISIDPVVDLRLGKDNQTQEKYLFQNTRALRVEGGLGKQFVFSATIAENWARYPVFLDRYAWVTRPAIIPGFGLNKSENKRFVDYPYAAGYFAYKPSKFFFFELGHGSHFIGEGYHSLFLSDNAGVSPYFKVEATFWKVKYTTMWTAYQDMRPEVSDEGVFRKKFSAIHYIDWNALPKLNLGFFETVVWHNTNRRGFDVNFLNPLIFFKTAEYEAGSDGSNTILGFSVRYKLPLKLQMYTQFVLDEMTISKFFGDPGYRHNKYGVQLGIKYHDAFGVPNLFLRAEYNKVRPYTYGHGNVLTNYGHNYQSLAHPWGANFEESIMEIQYRKGRFFAHNTFIIGKKGFDFPSDTLAYGGDIYHYGASNIHRENNYTLQGNLGQLAFNKFEAGYIVNPVTNLKLFGGFIYRKTSIEQPTKTVKNETSKYIYFGIKTHLWNDHYDVF